MVNSSYMFDDWAESVSVCEAGYTVVAVSEGSESGSGASVCYVSAIVKAAAGASDVSVCDVCGSEDVVGA